MRMNRLLTLKDSIKLYTAIGESRMRERERERERVKRNFTPLLFAPMSYSFISPSSASVVASLESRMHGTA